MNHATFIGWDNFVEAFHDPRFINSLKVTAIFTGIEVPVQVFGALIIAAFISKIIKGISSYVQCISSQ